MVSHPAAPDDAPLVWLPFDPVELGSPPAGLRYEVVDPVDGHPERLPDSVGQVRFWVPPYRMTPALADPLARMPALDVVQLLTAGHDHLAGRLPDGVRLCAGRGIHETSTAELAMTLILASLRGVPEAVRAADRGVWDRSPWAGERRPALADRRVLILGYGAIGEALERRLVPFEVDVVRVARSGRPGVHPIAEVSRLLPEVDVVVLLCPLTEETRGLVDAAFLAAMRPGALLVNLSRGPVVVTDDLLAALRAGHVTAALDVTDPEPLPDGHPLLTAPGVLLTPHVGGASTAMWPRAHRVVRDQLHRWVAGEPLAGVVTA